MTWEDDDQANDDICNRSAGDKYVAEEKVVVPPVRPTLPFLCVLLLRANHAVRDVTRKCVTSCFSIHIEKK